MKLSELYLNRYLYQDNKQNLETKDPVFISADSSETEKTPAYSGGAAQDINTGNVQFNGAYIIADTVDATKINVDQLSAISVDAGDLTAGNITGLTVTGGVVRTAASGQRVQMLGSTNRLEVYDGTPALIAWFGGISTDGAVVHIDSPSGATKSPFFITSVGDTNVIQLRNTKSDVAFPSIILTSNATGVSNQKCVAIVSNGGADAIGAFADSDVNGNALYVEQDGTALIINTNVVGCFLTKAGVWTDASTKKSKENFEDVTALDKLKTLDIKKYNYISEKIRTKAELKEKMIDRKKKEKYSKTEEGQKGRIKNDHLKMEITTEEQQEIDDKLDKEHIKEEKRFVPKHISPMAEDMYAMFGVGDGFGLAAKDIAGVALQAVKELLDRVEKLEKKGNPN